MRLLILLPLLCLAACSKPAEETAPAPASVAAPPPVTDAWNGRYEGDALRITVSGAPGAHKALLFVANEKCDGEIGLADDGVPAKEVSSTELDVTVTEDGFGTCRVNIKKAGDTLTLEEDAGCTSFHGAFCTFDGTALRVK